MNPLESLMTLFSDTNQWDWKVLPLNPHYSLAKCESDLRKGMPLDMYHTFKRFGSEQFIKEHAHIPIHWPGWTEAAPFSVILSQPEKPWHVYSFNYNKWVDIDFVVGHPEIPWNVSILGFNPNITYHEMKSLSHWKWHPHALLTKMPEHEIPEWLETHPHEAPVGLLLNPALTRDVLEPYMDRHWDMTVLSEHPCVTPDMVWDYPEKKWVVDGFASNPSWGWNDLIEYFPFESVMPWERLSANPALTLDFVEDHLSYPWSCRGFSRNPWKSLYSVLERCQRRNGLENRYEMGI